MIRLFRFLTPFLILPCFLMGQSPYRVSWDKDTYILGAGGGLALTGYLFYRAVTPLTDVQINELDRTSVNSFDRSATYNYSENAGEWSDIFRNTLAVAPFVFFLNENIRNDWKTITLMYSEVLAFSGGANLLVKGLTSRTRPYAYNPNAPISKKLSSDTRKSFYSGHTTIAFASAVFISTVFSDYYPDSDWKSYVWTGSLLTAGLVGYLRYDAGMHYPSDIIIGAITGSAFGYLIPWMHRNDKSNLSLIPNSTRAQYGFSIRVVF